MVLLHHHPATAGGSGWSLCILTETVVLVARILEVYIINTEWQVSQYLFAPEDMQH